MSWVAALTFALAAFGAAALAGVLAASIPTRPECSTVLTDGMRGIGLVITVAGLVLGAVMLGYAIVAYTG